MEIIAAFANRVKVNLPLVVSPQTFRSLVDIDAVAARKKEKAENLQDEKGRRRRWQRGESDWKTHGMAKYRSNRAEWGGEARPRTRGGAAGAATGRRNGWRVGGWRVVEESSDDWGDWKAKEEPSYDWEDWNRPAASGRGRSSGRSSDWWGR